MTDQSISDLAAPILKRFSLVGLNGYKTISLTCNSPMKIVSADNGSGKTSLLNAIYAVFAGRPALLYAIDFHTLIIEWGNGKLSAWRKHELFGVLSDEGIDKLTGDRLFSRWDVSREDAGELITKYLLGDLDEAAQTRAYRELYRDSPHDRQEIFDRLAALTDSVIQSGEFPKLHKEAQSALGECSVLYLPTYRRIEADIPEFRSGIQHNNSATINALRPRARPAKDPWDSTRLIFFGMNDVETKLVSIVTQIRKETLEAYSRSNGQTLEELVGNNPTIHDSSLEALDISSIEVVLARVGKLGELGGRLKDIIESGEIRTEGRRELRRFLSQLLRVYADRRDDEQAIGNFVDIVNKYLCPAPILDDAVIGVAEKSLTFDKLNLDIGVKNRISKDEIKFGALSSGEKQIVSLFARIMLDPRRRYFILIDEPELSLSLDWQQRLLLDIASTQNFRQLIAITHSPFIFDNSLNVFAGSLEIERFSAQGNDK